MENAEQSAEVRNLFEKAGVDILTLADGDIVVIRYDQDAMTLDEANRLAEDIQDFMQAHFEEHDINATCMVVPQSLEFAVLRSMKEAVDGVQQVDLSMPVGAGKTIRTVYDTANHPIGGYKE